MTSLVFLAVRGCAYEHGVRDALRERAQADRQVQARATIARERAAVADQVAALWNQGRYQDAYRVAAKYQAIQDEIDREVDRFRAVASVAALT
jgi:hypothetical protein